MSIYISNCVYVYLVFTDVFNGGKWPQIKMGPLQSSGRLCLFTLFAVKVGDYLHLLPVPFYQIYLHIYYKLVDFIRTKKYITFKYGQTPFSDRRTFVDGQTNNYKVIKKNL